MRVSIDMDEQRNRCTVLHTQGNTNHVYDIFATQVAAQFQLVAIVTVAITLHVYCIDIASSHSTCDRNVAQRRHYELLQQGLHVYSIWTHSLKLFYRAL